MTISLLIFLEKGRGFEEKREASHRYHMEAQLKSPLWEKHLPRAPHTPHLLEKQEWIVMALGILPLPEKKKGMVMVLDIVPLLEKKGEAVRALDTLPRLD